VDVQNVEDLQGAVGQARSIVTATASRRPLLLGDWLRPGQHVTAVGADAPGKSELDAAVLARASRLYVDSVDKNRQVGEISAALSDRVLSPRQITGELGQIVAGPPPRLEEEITVVKLVGLGVQDLAAALTVVQRLETPGPGSSVAVSDACEKS
jgi:ornithine cyclodeaminase